MENNNKHFTHCTTSFSVDIIEHAWYFQKQNQKEHHISHVAIRNHT
ncbi:Fe-Mn family superoxide dismutase, partial [Klebsiella pneumoniae]